MVRRRCCCFVALLMILSVSVEASTHRILVDTDGDGDSDDLFAILYLLKLNKSEFDFQGITVNANFWSNAGHAVNHIYDILYMMDRDDIPVGVGGEGGILEDGTIMPDVGGFFPLIDQGMSTAGGCRYRQSVPVGSGSQLRVDTNFGIRKGILPQVNNRDLSIAVLREFIKRRKQEHGAMLLGKRNRGKKKKKDVKDDVVEDGSGEASNNGVENGEKMNLDCGNELEKPVEEEGKEVEGNGLGVNAGEVEENKRKEIKPARVLEALSASGLRALRYAREVEDLGEVVALDNDKNSVEACRRNIKFNGSVASAKVKSELVDACAYMLSHQKEFDMVDLDPYGSPSIFLDCAVRSVVDGGMLMCTATDMAVLCGGNGEVCYSKYGSYPLKGKYCHEMALRILLNCIESHANRHKRYIVPVLSVQMDFYVRVFVRIYTSASAMKNTPLKLSYVYQCTGCDSFHLQPLGRTVSKNNSVRYMPGFGPAVLQECSDCGKKYNMGGPFWTAPIHDQEWVSSILADVTLMKDRYPAYGRISAVLTTVSEELPDVPLFLNLHNLCGTLKCTSPSIQCFRSAVINAGYRISGTHVDPLGMKTDAPMDVIWDIMRCWVKSHSVKPQPPETAGSVILAKEPVLQASFARAAASLSKAQAKKVARFLPNPESHWGPKLRAGRTVTSKHVSLLGQDALNGHLNHIEAEESNGKRQKTDDPDTDAFQA